MATFRGPTTQCQKHTKNVRRQKRSISAFLQDLPKANVGTWGSSRGALDLCNNIRSKQLWEDLIIIFLVTLAAQFVEACWRGGSRRSRRSNRATPAGRWARAADCRWSTAGAPASYRGECAWTQTASFSPSSLGKKNKTKQKKPRSSQTVTLLEKYQWLWWTV